MYDRRVYNVLWAEDDSSLREMGTEFLERFGDIEVTCVESAEEGIEYFIENRDQIDGIISDYDMGKMDGLEFLQQIRGKDEDIPFILFTGKGSEEVAEKAISSGVTGYRQKEVGVDQYRVLANSLENNIESYLAQEMLHEWYQDTENLPFGVAKLGPSGEITYTNPAFRDLIGAEEDPTGLNLEDLEDLQLPEISKDQDLKSERLDFDGREIRETLIPMNDGERYLATFIDEGSISEDL